MYILPSPPTAGEESTYRDVPAVNTHFCVPQARTLCIVLEHGPRRLRNLHQARNGSISAVGDDEYVVGVCACGHS